MRRAIAIVLSDEERATLTAWARSRTAPARLVTRARIVLAAADGAENQDIAAELGLARGTVVTWRQRFAADRVTGIGQERRGRGHKATKRKHWDRTIVEVTRHTTPKDRRTGARRRCQYREALESPPLLIVSDIARTEIHTNFTGTRAEVHELALADLARPEKLDLLRRVFTNPEAFRPGLTTAKITEDAAEFATLADALRPRGHNPPAAAHFLMKCMFCLFAEDVGRRRRANCWQNARFSAAITARGTRSARRKNATALTAPIGKR